jgi:hypothetical protein
MNKPRTPAERRRSAHFGTQASRQTTTGQYKYRRDVTMAEAVDRVLDELDKYTKVGQSHRVPEESIIISTNVPVKRDGFPVSSFRKPDDPGVAVYFELDGRPYCLPCDKWDRVEDNLAAVAAHIGAMRGIERWGVGETSDAYAGYKALPEYTMSEAEIWCALDLPGRPKDVAQVKEAYRNRVKKVHPDVTGGDQTKFLLLQRAYDFALKFFS